ncbi:unnamed protein product [Polarella glacialis]|uniref:Uncharacterized protein n=1 Tax=Polarella glacialis TaxID=89957 RepID=A0A813FNH1_POLGL|nr:unnamed protein product [Polarella glacialis]
MLMSISPCCSNMAGEDSALVMQDPEIASEIAVPSHTHRVCRITLVSTIAATLCVCFWVRPLQQDQSLEKSSEHFSGWDSVPLPNASALISLAEKFDTDGRITKALAVRNASYLNTRALESYPLYQPEDKDFQSRRPSEIATCSLDVLQSMFSIGQIGNAIHAAADECQGPDPHDFEGATLKRSTCAALTSQVVSVFLFMATFIGEAVSVCAGTFKLDSACSVDINGILASFAQLSASASSLVVACQDSTGNADSDELQALSLGLTRRLEMSHDIHKLNYPKDSPEEQEAAMKASCAFDVGQASLWVARIGLGITQASKDCVPAHIAKVGHVAKVACSIDVNQVIAAVAISASAISVSVTNCPAILNSTNNDALCAASIIDMVGIAAYVATAFSSIMETCGKLDS